MLEGLAKLKEECDVLFGDNKDFQPLDADLQKSAFVQPALLSCKNGRDAKFVHDVEVFGQWRHWWLMTVCKISLPSHAAVWVSCRIGIFQ